MIAIQPSKPLSAKSESARSGALLSRSRSERGDGPPPSFEFFPPKTEEMEEKLWQTIKRLEWLTPRCLVTMALADRRASAIIDRYPHSPRDSIEPAAHLTCVGASRGEIDAVALHYWEAGIRHIVALRGDPPIGGAGYAPHPDGYAYAADLVAGLRRVGDFEISVAAFPECHPEARSAGADLDNLKR